MAVFRNRTSGRQSWHYDRNYENIYYVTTVNYCDGNITIRSSSTLRFMDYLLLYDFKHIRNCCFVAYMGDRFEKDNGDYCTLMVFFGGRILL